MKYIYIKLSENLIELLYQVISAKIISEYQEGILVLDSESKFKNNVLKNYLFKNISCRNIYNEKINGQYNCFTTKFYKYNLELIGEFKNIDFFINRVDEFVKTLFIDGYEVEINLWLEQINQHKKNMKNSDLNSLNLYSNKYVDSVEHRGGWKDIINNLFINKLLSINDCDYYLIDIVENYHNYTELIIKKKWFGIIHSTEFVPEFLSICDIENIIKSSFLKNNIKECNGLITFSKKIKNILDGYNLGLSILFVKHPINTEKIELFNIDYFINNMDKKLVLLGKQLRKPSTIYLIKTIYKKIWLPGTKKHMDSSMQNLKKELNFLGKNIDNVNLDEVEIKYFDSYEDYDNFILSNIIVIDLWDANANNSVLECLIRNIPFFVSKIDGIIEYLSDDYPMYFNSLQELENILNNSDINKIYYKTHDYLKNMNKNDITFKNFNNELDIFFKSKINKIDTIFSNIKEHNNWSHIENYLHKRLSDLCFNKKLIFIPFVDLFILDKITLSAKNNNKAKWIGILHNPILTNIYPENDVFEKKIFLNYLSSCDGLFVMSEELKEYVINKFNPSFFVEVVKHPLPYINVEEWNYESYINNNEKKIIQVGNWLRKTYGIFKINVPKNFIKIITPFGDRTKNELKFWSELDNISISEEEYNNVIKYGFIESTEYNKLFKDNIFFLNLYNSTANNIILECIKSNCPIIVNNNPNIKKYLGNDYPLYYNSYSDIIDLITDENIKRAHLYLCNIDKTEFTNEFLFDRMFSILEKNNLVVKKI